LNSCRLDLPEIVYGEGLLHRWDGDAEGAVQALEQALALAQQRQDRWIESVRIVQHEADASYDRVWVAEMFGPGAAE